MIGHNYKAQQFSRQIHRLEARSQFTQDQDIASETSFPSLLDSFKRINDRGTLMALASSLFGASLISLGTTYSILRPLKRIEQSAQQFNTGDLGVCVPPSGIPEIHQLGLTLNSIASRLQGVEARRQELVSDLAHEISTPLTVILGYLEMVDTGTVQLTREVRQHLLEQAQRMKRLLTDLKVLSTIEDGSCPLRLQLVSPHPILHQVIAAFEVKGWQNPCVLKLDCPAQLPDIFVDPDRFERILTNLISNALAYTPEGTVTVCVRPVSDQLQIEVIDTGIGISQADLPFVFDRFWRSQHSRHLRCDGSGIGLAITKRLVEVMGGQIGVESALGKGTIFRLCLPLAASGAHPLEDAGAISSPAEA